jgi:hypothetical protein
VPYPPPDRGRRRKLRRGFAYFALALIALVGCCGFVYWRNTRFPARSEPLLGAPIELRIQSGVSARELSAIRDGLYLVQRHASSALGRSVRGPVEARVAHSNGCQPFEEAGGASVGEGKRGFLCIDTASPGWPWLVRKDFSAATAVSAHEYVHVLQGELGCLPAPGDQQFRWLIEGMANEVAWGALVAGRRATEARVERTLLENGALDPNLDPLQRYEREGGRDPEYALWQLAVRHLLRRAVSAGAAPVARPEFALRRFCVRVGRGQRWRAAFARSFGLPLRSFYAGFALARERRTLVSARQRHRYRRWLW